MPNLTGRWIHFRRMLVVLSLALVLLASPALAQSSTRLVAVGDVHGDYDALVSILQQAALIDSNLNWTGKNATLVQTGDLLDRGAKCRQVMDLFMKLEGEAPKSGGRVIALMGNHEAMNIIGDLRYAEAMYPSFADGNSERRRKAAYDAYAAWRKARAQAGVLPANGGKSDEATWMAAHPLGYVEQREAMSTNGTYGKWLRARPAVAVVGSTLFLHGGISPEVAELARTPDNIIKRVQSEAAQFDHLMRVFVRQKTILPNFDLAETLGAVQAELQYRKKNPGQLTADIASEKRQIDDLVEFTGLSGWFMVNPQGPLWFRGYASWNDEEGKTQIAKVLEKLGVSQIVVGHTPQADGRIAARFDGKVFLIDTGMLSSYYTGGRASALEIAAGKYTAIYADQRIVLLDSSARHGEAVVPAGHENYLYGEVPGGGIDEPQQSPAQQPAPAQQAAAPAPEKASPAAGPAPRVWYDPNGKPLPFKTDEEVMEFLRTAKVSKMKDIPTGVAHPRKALLEKDALQMNAKFSSIHEDKFSQELASGQRELNFRDDAIFDMAAQELGKMLGLDNLPPVVKRSVGGESGILQVWVENTMTERDRLKQGIKPPNPVSWNHQIYTMHLFDNLVANTDRNMGNILIDKDWKVWLIDHTRAFRRNSDLSTPGVTPPQKILQVNRDVWEKLQAMNDGEMKERLKPYLRGAEIDGVIKRRAKLVEYIKGEISKRGESEVIFSNE